MRSLRQVVFYLCLHSAASILASGLARGAFPVLEAMQMELDRSFEVLADQPTPVYFLSYEITEERSLLLASILRSGRGAFQE